MRQSFNVLHIVDHMGDGGVQSILRDLNRHSSIRIHSLRKAEEEKDSEENFTVTDSKSPYNFRCLMDLYSVLEKEEIDIVHCHLLKSKLAGFLLAMLPRKNFELIFHEHGDIYRESLFYNLFLNLADFKLAGLIAVSDYTADLLVKKTTINRDKIKVLHNFADKEEFGVKEINQKSLDINEERFNIGFLARLIERKGWKTVFQAAEEVQDKDIRFLIAGDGSDKEKVVEKAQNLDNLEYLGRIEDPKEFYDSLDCFILPSYWDPCPITLYEAQASETPVICSDAPAINEIMEDGKNCLMFDTKDGRGLKQKIMDLKTDKDLEQKIIENQRIFSERNSVESFKSDLEKTYKVISEE